MKFKIVDLNTRKNYNSSIIEGPVIFENEHYYTIQTKKYRTSINKYDIALGNVVKRNG